LKALKNGTKAAPATCIGCKRQLTQKFAEIVKRIETFSII